jgi:hypothetical protein
MADTSGESRNVEVYEKVEQVGEGTYGCGNARRNASRLSLWLQPRPPP